MASILIATAVIFLLGFGLIGYAVNDFIKKNRKKTWPQTTGEIIESNTDDIEEVVERNRHRKDKFFPLHIRYTYTVNLVPYESSTVSESSNEGIVAVEDELRAYAKRYQTGTKVTVYYDPENPENSILIPFARIGRLAISVLAGVSVLICGLSFLSVYYAGSYP